MTIEDSTLPTDDTFFIETEIFNRRYFEILILWNFVPYVDFDQSITDD